MSLLVLFRAKQWLSAAEQVPDLALSASTPKTLGQLRKALEDPLVAPHLPFAADFEDAAGYGPIVSRLLFYAEMSAARDTRYGTYSKPYGAPQTYGQLQELVFAQRKQHTSGAQVQRRVETADDLATMLQEFASDGIVLRALQDFALPPHRRKKAASVQPLLQSTAPGKLKTIDDSASLQWVVSLASSTAACIAEAFLEFLQQGQLTSPCAAMSSGQILSLCLLHSRLSWEKGKPLQFRESLQHCLPTPLYVPAAAVPAPSPAHFVGQLRAKSADAALPDIQAPQVCMLCGKGFIDPPALWGHCDAEHHSWAEAVKRAIWETEQLQDLPMLPAWKRRILANFAQALTYSKPGHGHYGRTKVCMRQLVGCVTCARVDWIDEFVPCYLFKECPEELLAQDNSDSEASADTDDPHEEKKRTRAQVLFRDDAGYYVRSAAAIDALLDVRKYSMAWPLIPPEELHASSIQHPTYPSYRWLLNTRRVPTVQPTAQSTAHPTAEPIGDDAAEHAAAASCQEPQLPPCAGVAVSDTPVWICFGCAKALCRPTPVMPFFALSNWNWGGRLHPLYRDLSVATETLLGLAIMVCRLIVLRYTDSPDEQEKGFVGNTILLAQPRPEEIMQTLPPSEPDVSKYMSVCFNSDKLSRTKVKSQKALTVDPAEYIRCARLRQQVCPVFRDVTVDEQRVREQWPEPGVPPGIAEGAQAMDTLHTFAPNLDGPASMRAASCQLPGADECNGNVVADSFDAAAAAAEHGEPGSNSSVCEESGLPLDLPAEFLIGVQECTTHDPVDRMVAFQKNLELVHELGAQMHAAAQKRARAKEDASAAAAAGEEAAQTAAAGVVGAAAELSAQMAAHSAALVDLRTVARSMGERYQQELEGALSSARMEDAQANTPQTLHVRSGKPINAFEPQAWPAAFVQFFYGDCAPNLDRPRRVSFKHLFKYLLEREELEYKLASDETDPLVPGGCYRAPLHSRWNTPEFAAVFADTVRKMAILTTTQHMWKNNASQWRVDIKTICSAKMAHFEKLATIMAQHGHQSLAQLTHAAAEHKLQPLLKALQYVTFQTANIPFTQGYKVSLRQLGYALNVYDGPLSIFLTCNFADTYSPITATLMNGAGEPLGQRSINLLTDCPRMPCLREIHRALAKHPMLQARLYLLLDELVHRELLCMMAHIGVQGYGKTQRSPRREDDYATTCQIGLAQIVRSAVKPLEAQGRGFEHGHEKVVSVPRTRAARLKELFSQSAAAAEHAEDELSRFCKAARQELLRAACSLQHDSAVVSGRQLGVPLRPEPFSQLQQRQCRHDGEVEEMHDNAPRRRLIPVTEPEPNGHIRAEAHRATLEQRLARDQYKELPLTGAMQSMMPMYRLPGSFGRIRIPDEYGHYPDAEAAAEHKVSCGLCTAGEEYVLGDNGEVTALRLPNGSEATPEDVSADAAAWATSFARDQRACFAQNHKHDCTATCVKYEKRSRLPTAPGTRHARGRKCRAPGFRSAGSASSPTLLSSSKASSSMSCAAARVSCRKSSSPQATRRTNMEEPRPFAQCHSRPRLRTCCSPQSVAMQTTSIRRDASPTSTSPSGRKTRRRLQSHPASWSISCAASGLFSPGRSPLRWPQP